MRQGAMGKGTMHQMIARMAFIVSGYAINIAMVYLLGDPVSYGLLGIVINMTNIARVLVSTGLPQATSKFIADNDDDLTYPILRTSMKLQWIIGGGHRGGLRGGRDTVGQPAQRPVARAVLLGRRHR